jgi:hypothetical protein
MPILNLVFEALQELNTVEMVDFIKGKENYFEIQSRTNRSSRRDVFQLCRDKNWFLTELTPLGNQTRRCVQRTNYELNSKFQIPNSKFQYYQQSRILTAIPNLKFGILNLEKK